MVAPRQRHPLLNATPLAQGNSGSRALSCNGQTIYNVLQTVSAFAAQTDMGLKVRGVSLNNTLHRTITYSPSSPPTLDVTNL